VTGATRGWRPGAGAAVAVTAGDPGSWALGLLGFLARGGWLVLALPILTIPSPVLLSLLFRGEVGAIGRGELRLLSIGVGAVLSLVAIGGVILSAYADTALAERFVRDPETEELRGGRVARPLTRTERRSLVWWVASIQAVALLPLILAITLVIDGAVRTATSELIDPSTGSLSLVGRVVPVIAGPIALLVLVVVVVEALSSLASRRLLANAWDLLPGGHVDARDGRVAVGALARVVRSPLRVMATAVAGWLAIGLTLVVALVASVLAWGAARDVLVMGRVAADPVALGVSALLVAVFTGVWLAGLGLVGFASAVRSGLWTADALR